MISKRDNIAEYILHLWQLEDFLRAFPEQAEQNEELRELQNMMLTEGIKEKGHLQIARVAMGEAEQVHMALLDNDATYKGAYLQVLPALTLLKGKSDNPTMSDIEMCFAFLYNIMLLHLRQQPISEDTQYAQKQVSALLAHISRTYQTAKDDPEAEI